ncbi:MAG: sigma 54-interacting transcriptional regulator [Thermodesulfobacteriota bacterium]|nr:sigma 54-interacting transcriptional regulator [Thermodesulfobacteriota bacterium]
MVNPKTFSTYIQKFEELKTVFDSLPDGIVAILDPEMNISTANKTLAKMLGMRADDIVGKKYTEIFKSDITGLVEVIEETFKSKKGIRNYATDYITPAGELHTFLVSTAIIEEIDMSETAIVLILHDVSEVTRLRKLAMQMQHYGEIIGSSPEMKKIFAMIESLKHYNTSVLIQGETGTGKELIARAIHNNSDRKEKPFVPVNCSALAENLVESELFGHVKGAFTGAANNRLGRFQVAHRGTLFLDEVGTLHLDTQVKLLRGLQEKIVEPVGSSKGVDVDVRVISATNRDLAELIAKGEFRDDLFFRLKVMKINLPPLRERTEDIPLLVNHFINRLNTLYDRNVLGLSPTAGELLMNYSWPGNIRELENAMEHAFVLTLGSLVEAQYLPAEVRLADNDGNPPAPALNIAPDDEEERIRRSLLVAKGRINKAAEALHVHRSTLWRKMREYKIDKHFGKK